MKFLILSSELKFSGPNNVILSLVSGLTKIGVNVVVCGLRNSFDEDYVQKLYLKGAEVITLPKGQSSLKFVSDMLNKHNPDIVNSHGIRADVFCYFLKKIKKFKHIVTVHNVPYEDYPSRYSRLTSTLMLVCHSLVFKSKNSIKAAVSNNVKKNLDAHGALNVHVVYNGVVPDSFVNAPDRDDLVNRLGFSIDHKRKRFVFCGHLTDIKQPLMMKSLAKEFPHFDFIVLGDGPLKNDMLEGKTANLYVLGRVNNVHEYMAVSDYFIMPSLTEGMPMAFIEALFSGLYLVCSDIDIFKELNNIKEIEMSLFNVGDKKDLMRVVENLPSRNNMNKQVASELFSDVVMSKAYLKII